jgi:hypothetical protein
MKAQLTDFNNKNCKLFDPPMIFVGLFYATGGDPCHTGCCYFDNNECKGIEGRDAIQIALRVSMLKQTSKGDKLWV